MSEQYQGMHFDTGHCPRTVINVGMWSYLAVAGGDSPDLYVSGLRGGVKYYPFEELDDRGIPLYGEGRSIAGLDGWCLNVIPLPSDSDGLTTLLLHSGGKYCFVESGSSPRVVGEIHETHMNGYLDLHHYGRNVSTASLFRRAETLELIVTVADMSEYYPGERGVYGGRAIGIDQTGRNIGYSDDGSWLGGRGKAELFLFVVGDYYGAPDLRFQGRMTAEGKPLEILDRSGSNAVADFDGDGNLEMVLLNAWKLEGYRLASEPGDTDLTPLGIVQEPSGNFNMDIQFPSPTPILLPEKTKPDLIMGSFSGEVFFSPNKSSHAGELVFERQKRVMCRDTIFRLGGFAVPAFGDLTGNGRQDLVVGVEDGEIYYIENKGTAVEPSWAAPELIEADGEPIRITAGYGGDIQGPDERLHGYACPVLSDWTGSGTLDLIVGNITGYYYLYSNEGSPSMPLFSAPRIFQVSGRDYRGEWRVRPAVADLDGDGAKELIFLDTQGLIARFPKSSESDTSIERGIRLVDNLGRWIRLDGTSGSQGRVKL
ncbi:MAG: hypothetical protein HN368_20445, partial [Spirochaetales bacterium]|nr:hypothetical protein [Spirochaetales bacterium]